MNLKKIISLEFGVPFLRKILKKLYREGHYYKVRFGKLRGLKSYYRKDINFHTLIGFWETESIDLLDKIIRQFGWKDKKIVVADVGANLGFYSMYFSKHLSPSSRIYAFEPSVSILEVLKNNININHLKNVEIVEAACAETTGTVEFYIGENHHTSSMLDRWSNNSSTGTLTKVDSISLDDFFGSERIGEYPDLIKMDIEGSGVYALKGCDLCLKIKRPIILMESHTGAEDFAVGNVLSNYDYEALRISTNKWILHKDRNYEDPNGVWGNMLLVPAEKMLTFKN